MKFLINRFLKNLTHIYYIKIVALERTTKSKEVLYKNWHRANRSTSLIVLKYKYIFLETVEKN